MKIILDIVGIAQISTFKWCIYGFLMRSPWWYLVPLCTSYAVLLKRNTPFLKVNLKTRLIFLIRFLILLMHELTNFQPRHISFNSFTIHNLGLFMSYLFTTLMLLKLPFLFVLFARSKLFIEFIFAVPLYA